VLIHDQKLDAESRRHNSKSIDDKGDARIFDKSAVWVAPRGECAMLGAT